MKFVYADSLDYVDPDFDFVADRSARDRKAHRDDAFPHEFLDRPPYDGILVSRAIVGDHIFPGKYSEAQSFRFRREGARAFLRYSEEQFPGSIVIGDCGAFSYRDMEVPPYDIDDTIEFYADGGFTHGCSIDHLIFDFADNDGAPASEVAQARFDITLQLATQFIDASKQLGHRFTPLGVVQGWDALSMGEAAAQLVKMGYTYLAVGGMVPLKMSQIHRALAAIRERIPTSVRLHLLGFGKIEELTELEQYGVASFDTTSPLLRAFKDAYKNYFHRSPAGILDFYTAVRIPQALENPKLKRQAKRGLVDQENLLRLERTALEQVRGYAAGSGQVSSAVAAIIDYVRVAFWDEKSTPARNEARLSQLGKLYTRTLGDRPWEECECRVCREGGVEALIFRSSNRNKRRGMHNLQVFHTHLQHAKGAAE